MGTVETSECLDLLSDARSAVSIRAFAGTADAGGTNGDVRRRVGGGTRVSDTDGVTAEAASTATALAAGTAFAARAGDGARIPDAGHTAVTAGTAVLTGGAGSAATTGTYS